MQVGDIVKRPSLARPLLVLAALALVGCNSGTSSPKPNDSGAGPTADARPADDTMPGRPDAADDVGGLTDTTVASDVTPGADQARPADVVPASDGPVRDDTLSAPDATPDTTVKNDVGPGADAGPRQDASAPGDAGADTAVPADVRPDGTTVSDGNRSTDLAPDAGGPATDTTVNDPSGTLYIAVDGDDGNPGTKDKPLASIEKASSLAKPGTLIYMRGGTYKLAATVTVSSPAGTAQDPIRLWASPGDSVVLDFAGASITKGLSIDASYWHVKGLVVENSAGRGLQVSTGTGIVIENCETRYNGDMGLVVSNGASNALVLNCDSHHNFDDANSGENADGFGAKSNVGTGVIFRNCRAWANSDDGWDLYGAPSAVRFENCWAYKNGDNFKNISGFAGDGNGFKLGKSDGDAAHHVLVGCLAWDNLGGNGYEDNNNTGGLTFLNSVAYKNKGASFEAINNTNHILKNNLAFANGKPENILTGSVVSNNSWNGFTVTEADFLSLDDSVAVGPRPADGSLPASNFLHLAPTSGLVDKGVDVGLPFLGAAPDLGAYEAK
jgi:hypothetical protein